MCLSKDGNGQKKWLKRAFPKLEMAKTKPRLALLNSLYGTKGKRTVCGNLRGGPHVAAQASKKCKEMIAQKAKMKGNKGIAAEIAQKCFYKDRNGQNVLL